MPCNGRAKSCHFSGTKSRWFIWTQWHLHDKRFTPWHAIWPGNELLTVYVRVRKDACQAVVNISKCSRHGTHWHALSLNSCAYAHYLWTVHEVASKWRCDKSWHLGNFNIFPRICYALFHLTGIHASARITCHGVNRLSVLVSRFAQVIKLCWFLVVQCQLKIILLRCFFKTQLKRFTFKEFGVSN